jgi:hypothetical protein
MSEAVTKSFERRLKDQLDKKEQMLTDLKKKYGDQSSNEISQQAASSGMKQLVSKKLIQQI